MGEREDLSLSVIYKSTKHYWLPLHKLYKVSDGRVTTLVHGSDDESCLAAVGRHYQERAR